MAAKAVFAFAAGSRGYNDYLEHSLIKYLFAGLIVFSAVVGDNCGKNKS
ncbi:hypothetical protein RFW18_06785 [Metabacillus idriensis]|nr:hypothetical protein [Metabacillus idriensis]MDR0137451.1 hypothetical protein [Metabacillus idriensis]